MHLHLVGIGGSGMSAIAHVLLERGYVVSGSDLLENESVEMLRERGAVVTIGHAGKISGADAVIISSAIPVDNPEACGCARCRYSRIEAFRFSALFDGGHRLALLWPARMAKRQPRP